MQDKKYKIIISDKALQMFASHISFLAQVNKNAAVRLKNTIMKEIKELEYLPEKYSWLIDDMLPIKKYHKKLINKRYLIIYQIKENTVYVEYIIDGREKYQWLIR